MFKEFSSFFSFSKVDASFHSNQRVFRATSVTALNCSLSYEPCAAPPRKYKSLVNITLEIENNQEKLIKEPKLATDLNVVYQLFSRLKERAGEKKTKDFNQHAGYCKCCKGVQWKRNKSCSFCNYRPNAR